MGAEFPSETRQADARQRGPRGAWTAPQLFPREQASLHHPCPRFPARPNRFPENRNRLASAETRFLLPTAGASSFLGLSFTSLRKVCEARSSRGSLPTTVVLLVLFSS